MPYLTADEISTHLYGEVTTEINRSNDVVEYPTLADFPNPGDAIKIYKDVSTGLFYKWITVAYVETAYKTPLDEAVKAATEEAKGYLTDYDVTAIFAATDDDRNPILLLYVKDIAVWHFIQLSNPGVEMEARKTRYEFAIKWLQKIQDGKTNPSLPTIAPPVDGSDQQIQVKWGGNTKRKNNF